MALLSHLSQAAEFLLVAADRFPQAGALLLHPSQQPLELLYAMASPLVGFLRAPQLILLFTQSHPQSAAFGLEET